MNRIVRALGWTLLSAGAISAHAAGSVAAGKTRATLCVACHGLDGLSRIPEAPNLAGQVESYLANQLQAFKSGERRNEQMAIIAKLLSPQDIDDLAAYYASLETPHAASSPRS